MPMPFTRPIAHTQTVQITLPPLRGGSPGLALPPSQPVALPMGGPKMHTVADPSHVIPTNYRRK
jgi:hypothetical protein